MTTPIEVDCGGFTAKVSIDRDTGDDVPVLRVAQDDDFVIFDATQLAPLLAALAAMQEALRDLQQEPASAA